MDIDNKNKLAWFMWANLALAYFISLFHRNSMAVVIDLVMADLAISSALVASSLAGTYAISYMIMQVPAGLMADFLGPRRTVSAGMLVAALGSLIFATSANLEMAFLGRVFIGLGVSVIFASALKFQIYWFKAAQFATISGLTVLIGNLGSVAGTTPMAWLVSGIGWRGSFIAVAAVTVMIALSCWIFVKDGIPEDQTGKEKKKTTYSAILEAIRIVFKNANNWYLFICNFGYGGFILAFLGTWSIAYFMHVYGLSRSEAAGIALLIMIGKMIGFPFAGFISDRLGRRKPVMLVFYTFTLVFWFVLIVFGTINAALLKPLFGLIGIAMGALIIMPVMAKERNSAAYSGLAISFVNMGSFLGMAFFQLLMGYLLDLKWQGLIIDGTRIYPLEAYRFMLGGCLAIAIACFLLSFKISDRSKTAGSPKSSA